MTSLSLDLRSYPGEVSAHDHPYHQVILALEGALEMEIGTSGGRCAEGRVDQARGALVPAGTLHAFSGIGRNRFVTLDIGSDSRAAPRRLLASGSPFFAVPRAVEHLLPGLGLGESGGQQRRHVFRLGRQAVPRFDIVQQVLDRARHGEER